MADLFWNVSTSYLALGLDAVVVLLALVVGYLPLVKYVPGVGPYVPAARIIAVWVMLLMAFMIGFRISDERDALKELQSEVEAKSIDLDATVEAEKQSNEARALLAAQATKDQERIADYETALKEHPATACALTDDDLRWMRDGAVPRGKKPPVRK